MSTTTRAVLAASSLSKGCARPTLATTRATMSSGNENLCTGTSRNGDGNVRAYPQAQLSEMTLYAIRCEHFRTPANRGPVGRMGPKIIGAAAQGPRANCGV